MQLALFLIGTGIIALLVGHSIWKDAKKRSEIESRWKVLDDEDNYHHTIDSSSSTYRKFLLRVRSCFFFFR